MSLRYAYRLSDGRFLCGGPGEPECDRRTQGVATVTRHPNVDTEVFDAAVPGQIRAATPQELSVIATERTADREAGLLNGQELLLAVVIWVAQRMNVPLATARQEIIAIRRGL